MYLDPSKVNVALPKENNIAVEIKKINNKNMNRGCELKVRRQRITINAIESITVAALSIIL